MLKNVPIEKTLKRREIQRLIVKELETHGWNASIEKILPNCVAEIIAVKTIEIIGFFKFVILVKKYKATNLVRSRDIALLELLVGKANASKGTIIATSKCAPDVEGLIKECEYKISYEYIESIDEQVYDNGEKDTGFKLNF